MSVERSLRAGENFLWPILAGVLTWRIFSVVGWWWVAYFCLVPLLLLGQVQASQATWRRYAGWGFLFGFTLLFLFHNWLFTLKAWAPSYLVVLLWVGMALYYALFYGASFALFGWLRDGSWRDVLLFPAVWVAGEWLRGLGSFGNTAASLGYSQTSCLPILQLASWGGVYALSFLLALVNMLVYKIIFSQGAWGVKPQTRDAKRWWYLGVLGFVLAVMMIGGCWELAQKNRANQRALLSGQQVIKVGLIQANYAQQEKLSPQSWLQMRQEYLLKSYVLAEEKPTLILWPETITPALNLRDKDFVQALQELARTHKVTIIWGTPLADQGAYFNSVVVTDGVGKEALNAYQKMRLMPFGEYWPKRTFWSRFYPGLVGVADYSAAGQQGLLRTGGVRLGMAICLESTYPLFLRSAAEQGANILGVVANNAWFFQSAAAPEHLQMSVMRAVENNRYLLQAANAGISAVVANSGRVEKSVPLGRAEVLLAKAVLIEKPSLYTLLGDWLVVMSWLLIWGAVIIKFVTQKARRSALTT